MKKPEGNAKSERGEDCIVLSSHTVDRVTCFKDGSVVADITLNGVKIFGVRVIEGKNGDFLSMPSRKGSDGNYYSHVFVRFSESDQKKILKEIEDQLNK